MYICICNALKEKDLQNACQSGFHSDGESVLKKIGCQKQCGQCLDYIEDVLLPA